MKKSIIAAGAASVALAAMPVVGVFAATKTVEDDIEVTINSTCSMTRQGASGSQGTWTPAAENPTTTPGTYSVTMDAGALANLGTSTISVTCNDTTAGHYLTVAATGLAGQGTISAESIPYSTTAAEAGTSSWDIVIGRPQDTTIPEWNSGSVTNDNIANITQTSGTGSVDLYGSSSATNKTVLNAATFTATYNVATAITQKSGLYTGSAIYTLTHGV